MISDHDFEQTLNILTSGNHVVSLETFYPRALVATMNHHLRLTWAINRRLVRGWENKVCKLKLLNFWTECQIFLLALNIWRSISWNHRLFSSVSLCDRNWHERSNFTITHVTNKQERIRTWSHSSWFFSYCFSYSHHLFTWQCIDIEKRN